MSSIYDFLQARFSGPEPKVFFELGAHIGTDTVKLAALPNVTVHAFEPDPRNHVPALPNVIFNRVAVAAQDGHAPFYPSAMRGGREWTCSGSLHFPTGHLTAYPDVTFAPQALEVETVTLDRYAREHGIEHVDFIWADTQGAEGDLLLGGHELLTRTSYLYTEVCEPALYEGQWTLAQILAFLPGWRLLARYGAERAAYFDVLLERTRG